MSSLHAAALWIMGTLAPGTLPTATQVTAVPPELLAQVREIAPRRRYTPEERLDRLFRFVFGAEGLNLQYAGSTTLTVGELAREHQANCLSFSLLFVALARELGLDAYVQETDHVLSWYQGGGDVYRAGHVNVGVRIGRLRHTVDIDRSILIASSAPRKISDRRALAHFYNNRGAELMAGGDMAGARRHLETAVATAPDHIAAWNNLGVLNMREGQREEAERAYATALAANGNYTSALFNLVNLHRKYGDTTKSRAFQDRLDKARFNDPFQQYLLGTEAEGRGDPAAAIRHYQRAIRLHQREHRFHFGLARAYAQLGDLGHAQQSLARARTLASKELASYYQAKLEKLQQDRL